MVRAITGALIECDPAVRQILIDLDNQAPPDEKFIIKKLDDTHLLIKSQFVDSVKEQLEDILEENTYRAPDLM
ncbi:General transcription factor IIH subunit 5 [Rhizophlyctis rosea]|uniref:General transcription and DNA repair factor IIH subunit TFB5 n=1 Tax=Rhizophlyctis rosea TaxID=64517 RepID=A0AAD5X0X8_9FUNG|nr:General transcription factor IIH subunit 5 [Rhizophlyctis rosea]